MPPSFFKKNAGYSMIEIIIAMAIFSIGILSVARLQFCTIKNNSSGNFLTQATLLAQEQMEQLKSAPLDSHDLTDKTDFQDPNNPMDPHGNPGGIYKRKWTIETPEAGLKRITVTVTWERNFGKTGSIQLTAITQGGGI